MGKADYWNDDDCFAVGNPCPVAVYLKVSASNPPLELPGDAHALRVALDEVSEDLIVSRNLRFGGWETIVTLKREKADAVLRALYGDEYPEFLSELVASSPLDELVLYGYWD